MIARILTASVLVLGLASLGYAQENAPASAAAAVTTAAPAATDAVPAPAAAPASAMAAVVVDPKDYRIGPEDVLDVLVWKNPELSRTVPVRPDGKISLALVNDIVASGLTANELRAQLTDRYSQFIQAPEVSVIIKEIHSFKVSVQGNVRMAGQFEVKSQATVLDMIARAQGFNEFADKGDIRVLRTTNGKTQAIKFKFNDATDGREGANFLVLPGDVIVVN
jgi:polysaccharide biosynthesis/export protein